MLATKDLFREVFDWKFKDWGDKYMDSHDGGPAIRIYIADLKSSYESGGALVTIYSEDLESTLTGVTENGSRITGDIFSLEGNPASSNS